MMLELTHKGKHCYVQFSAVLLIRKRFFFKGSVIVLMGGVKILVDQDPRTIIGSVANANMEARKKQ